MAQGRSEQGQAHGRGPDFHGACMQAYEAAKQAGLKPPFEVAEIHLEGTNPFDNFRIVVKSSGTA